MKISEFIKSENYNERTSDQIDMLILHYTATRDADEAVRIMTDPKRAVSAHYLVCEDGRIIQLVDEKHRAWHAGQSFWQGCTDINSRSIGIEIQNLGHDGGCPPYPKAQMDAVRKLCKDIISRHPIPPENVLGHSDVAPDRKIDPGEHFPWQKLARAGIGRWPKGKVREEFNTASLDDLLLKMGYDPNVKPEERARAFYMHFYPQGIGKDAAKAERIAMRRAKKWLDFS